MSNGCKDPAKMSALVGQFIGYFSACAALSILMILLVRINSSSEIWPYLTRLAQDTLLRYTYYAFWFGALGACVNAVLSAAKHHAEQDFNDRWSWWYWTRPPMGAVMGAVMYILAGGFTGFLASASIKNGVGVAALAFLAGFAVERGARKIEELSKTIFKIDTPTLTASILEPAEGQHIGSLVKVVVHAPEMTDFLEASCLDDPAPPADLDYCGTERWQGELTLLSPPDGEVTIHVAGLCDGQELKANAKVKYQG